MDNSYKELIITEHSHFTQFSQYLNADALWRADAYLIVGETNAVLYDTLVFGCDLYKEVRRRTQGKPLTVVISHGHYDHAGEALRDFLDAGVAAYMSYADKTALYRMYGAGYFLDDFLPLQDNMVFDLGGRSLESMPVSGHSPGCTVLIDSMTENIYTADAIGAGECNMSNGYEETSLERTLREAKALLKRLEPMKDPHIWTGHSNMVEGGFRDRAYLEEFVSLLDDIVQGRVEGERYYREGEALYTTRLCARNGVQLLYNDHRIWD